MSHVVHATASYSGGSRWSLCGRREPRYCTASWSCVTCKQCLKHGNYKEHDNYKGNTAYES